MTATHIPVVAQATRDEVAAGAAIYHTVPGLAVAALGAVWTWVHWSDDTERRTRLRLRPDRQMPLARRPAPVGGGRDPECVAAAAITPASPLSCRIRSAVRAVMLGRAVNRGARSESQLHRDTHEAPLPEGSGARCHLVRG
ncbi:MAG TPA: hypothetical protein VK988_03820 [Acidimicrobiales bacterium]|nr:hypothetical protein [Acidimicrobiales bacterium]